MYINLPEDPNDRLYIHADKKGVHRAALLTHEVADKFIKKATETIAELKKETGKSPFISYDRRLGEIAHYARIWAHWDLTTHYLICGSYVEYKDTLIEYSKILHTRIKSQKLKTWMYKILTMIELHSTIRNYHAKVRSSQVDKIANAYISEIERICKW